jgi:hypothetical protein
MRFTRTIALLGVGLLWLGFGPLVLLLAGISLCFRQVRDWLRPTRRVVLAWVGAVLALAAVAYAVPDGWVRLPPGPGHLVTPGYVGRPATAQPVKGLLLESPHLAPGGSRWPGPMGDSPHVWTKSYGVDGCQRIAVDSHGRLVSLCGSADAPVLRLVDPDNLRQLASKDLPERDDSPCFGAFYVDAHDRAVVATTDRRILLVSTADAEGDPDLTTQATVGIEDDIPDEDCVVGLQPDWQGRTWFVSAGGRVGVVDDGKVRVADLAEQVDRPLTVTRDGVYVVSEEAVYRIGAAAGAKPTLAWRTPYDGTSGSAPVVLSSGLVAVAVNGDSGLQVVLHRPGDGAEVCHTAVFGDDDSSTDGGLVAAGDAVVVQNASGSVVRPGPGRRRLRGRLVHRPRRPQLAAGRLARERPGLHLPQAAQLAGRRRVVPRRRRPAHRPARLRSPHRPDGLRRQPPRRGRARPGRLGVRPGPRRPGPGPRRPRRLRPPVVVSRLRRSTPSHPNHRVETIPRVRGSAPR